MYKYNTYLQGNTAASENGVHTIKMLSKMFRMIDSCILSWILAVNERCSCRDMLKNEVNAMRCGCSWQAGSEGIKSLTKCCDWTSQKFNPHAGRTLSAAWITL